MQVQINEIVKVKYRKEYEGKTTLNCVTVQGQYETQVSFVFANGTTPKVEDGAFMEVKGQAIFGVRSGTSKESGQPYTIVSFADDGLKCKQVQATFA